MMRTHVFQTVIKPAPSFRSVLTKTITLKTEQYSNTVFGRNLATTEVANGHNLGEYEGYRRFRLSLDQGT